MSTLRIRFAPYVSDSGKAVVPLRIIDRNWRNIAGNWELTLDNPVDVPVEPGNFTVQAFMPTGEVISQEVAVVANETADVSLEPEIASPREDLAWGYLLKGTSRAAAAKHRHTWSIEARDPVLELWELSYDQRWDKIGLPAPLQHRVDGASFGSGSMRTSGKLVWLRIAWTAERAKFVALPPAETVRFNLFYDPPEIEGGDPVNVVVDAGNPRAESILGYLRRGDFASARQVGANFTAENLLREKLRDPASAAIGGYFLLQAADFVRLHNWTERLSEWFEYIPDGAVILAWHALWSSPPDFDLARGQLIEATHRGLPVYTIGLRLLSDGLSLCAARALKLTGKEDSDIARALEIVGTYAAAADWASAATSFYGMQPDKPWHY